METEGKHSGAFCFQKYNRNLRLDSSTKIGAGVSDIFSSILCFWQLILLYLAKVPDCDGLGQKGPSPQQLGVI